MARFPIGFRIRTFIHWLCTARWWGDLKSGLSLYRCMHCGKKWKHRWRKDRDQPEWEECSICGAGRFARSKASG